jgi:hypothetical protein
LVDAETPPVLSGGMEQGEFLKLTPEALEALRSAKTSEIALTRYEPCLCGKLLDTTVWLKKWHSGRWEGGKQLTPGINYTALLCEDCEKEFRDWPRIVCLSCRSLMGFYKYGRQATGFVFEKNRHYHIVDCPRCLPSRRSTPVLEHERFCAANKIKTMTPHDLLQEIEIKLLQAEREAARLRAAFEASAPK